LGRNKVYSLSCHPDRDADIISVLSRQPNVSAYLRSAIRFYEQHGHGVPKDELLARLSSIEERLSQIARVEVAGNDELIPDEAIYQLDSILSQIENGEFE